MAVVIERRMLLEPMDLRVPAGSWFGIVGPNGGGKSTLIKALAGLVPHRGRITLSWPGVAGGRVGYMPQRAEPDAALPVTAQDYLRLRSERRPVWLKPQGNARAEALIDQLEVRPFLLQRIGTLSMGQYQRLMLCASLLTDPQLLLLDEPLAGVDEVGRSVLLRALAAYHNEGGTVLMVEHNWSVVRECCEQVLWIDGGLIGQGPPETVFQSLSSSQSLLDLEQARERVSDSQGLTADSMTTSGSSGDA